ncbi:MAG: hypothetical protein AB7G25_15235 [Sphingomonadaceae bacterium]
MKGVLLKPFIFSILMLAGASSAGAADWPTELICEDQKSLICKQFDGFCTPHSSTLVKSIWRLNLEFSSYDQYQVVDGKDVPNFSGTILHRQERIANGYSPQLTMVTNGMTLITLSYAFDKLWRRLDGQYMATFQSSLIGGSLIVWATCRPTPMKHTQQ